MEKTVEQLKRARKVALVLATVSILITIYALVQKSMAEVQTSKVYELTEELELCKQK